MQEDELKEKLEEKVEPEVIEQPADAQEPQEIPQGDTLAPEQDTVEQEPQVPQERMFSQEELNSIIAKRIAETKESAQRSLYDKYGVDNDNDLDGIFGKGQCYDVLNDNYNDINNQLMAVKAENALLKSGIDQGRWDDAKLILNGKGLEINEENIANELITHPEWKGMAQSEPQAPQQMGVEMAEQFATKAQAPTQAPQPVGEIRRFGSDVPESPEQLPDEDAMIKKLFSI